MEQVGRRDSFRFIGVIPRVGAIVSNYISMLRVSMQGGGYL